MKDKKIVVDGLLTTYGQAGNGPVVLLLHGWGDDHRTFEVLAGALSNNYTVIAPDLPGFGQTQLPGSAWDLDGYSEFVAAFLAKVEAQDISAVVGHSNGGAIAIRALSRGVIASDKLILLAASGIRENNTYKRVSLAAAAKLGKVVTTPLPPAMRQKMQKKLYHLAGSDLLEAPHLRESFKRIVRQDIKASAAKLTLPALLIYGDRDTATPLKVGRTFQQLIQGSRLEIARGSGHFVHLENPGLVSDKIQDFLS